MKTQLTYGFGIALAGALIVFAEYFLGFHSDPAKFPTGQIIGAVGGTAVTIVGIVLGMRARRAEVATSEDFSYGRALGTGVMIVLFASLFGLVFNYVYFAFINPEFREILVQSELAKLEAKGLSSDALEGAEKGIRMFTAPAIQAVFGFFGGMLFGTVISLIAAAFVKRSAVESLGEPPPMST